MIGYIKGKVVANFQDSLCVEPEGQSIGYEVFVTQYDQVLDGQKIQLWIYSHVREDVFHLYGFSCLEDKKAFLSLLKVNGVGPKLALSILSSCHGVSLLSQWVDQANIKALSGLPRVGKKKAELICLGLKDKLPKSVNSELSLMDLQIESALKNLGFKSDQISKVFKSQLKNTVFEDRLREAFSFLSNTQGADA